MSEQVELSDIVKLLEDYREKRIQFAKDTEHLPMTVGWYEKDMNEAARKAAEAMIRYTVDLGDMEPEDIDKDALF